MTRSWRGPLERAACSLSKLEDEALPRPDRRSRDILPDSAVSADMQRRSIGTAEQVARGVGPGRKDAFCRADRDAGHCGAAQVRHYQHRMLARATHVGGDLGAAG